MLDPRRLRLLVEFERRGTVAAVADALSYTPSAVSQQLAALEREAGVSLFEHVGRRLILTDLGRLLVRDSIDVLAALENAEADLVRAAGQVAGVVRLAAIATIARTLLPPALAALASNSPSAIVEFREAEIDEAMPLLDAGEVDLIAAQRGAFPNDPRYDERLLRVDPLLLALPRAHPLVARSEIPLELLADAPWVSARAGGTYDEMLRGVCRDVGGFEPQIRHRSDNVNVVVGLVAAGAVGMIPSLGWPGDESGTVLRPVSGRTLVRELFTTTRSTSAQRPTIGAVRQALHDASARLGRPALPAADRAPRRASTR